MDLELREEKHLFAGRYQLQRRVGAGGMGQVYLARDTLLEQDNVALKLLHTSLSVDERQVKRFLREVHLTRKVTHTNVVRTFEVGEAEGHLYFTMEYVEGQTVRELLQERSISLEEALNILIQAAQGLRAIHEHSIIHRDFKPGNLLLMPSGSLKITDFGVARPYSSELTNHDEVLGSVPYMAPEVWTGGEIGVEADLYSFGVVAYELLTGILPFEGECAPELMYKHLSVIPQRPSSLVGTVPEELDRLTLKLLEKKSEARFRSAEEVAYQLELIREKCTTNDGAVYVPSSSDDLFALPPDTTVNEYPLLEAAPLLSWATTSAQLFGDGEEEQELSEEAESWERLGRVLFAVLSAFITGGVASLALALLPQYPATPLRRFVISVSELTLIPLILSTPLLGVGLVKQEVLFAFATTLRLALRLVMTGAFLVGLESLVLVIRSSQLGLDQILEALSVGSVTTLLLKSFLLCTDTAPRLSVLHTCSIPPTVIFLTIATTVWLSYIGGMISLLDKRRANLLFTVTGLLICLNCFMVAGPFVSSSLDSLLGSNSYLISFRSFEYLFNVREVAWAAFGWFLVLALVWTLPDREHSDNEQETS